MIVTVEVTDRAIASTLVTAFETGSRGWCEPGKVAEDNPAFKGFPWYAAWPVAVIFLNEEDFLEKEFLLNEVKIRRGLKLMLEKSPSHFADVAMGDADVDVADLFLQYCVFGEEKYA